VRLRGMVALLSRELFGVALALPDFPVVKSVRGIGMSDPPELATPLAEKLDYTNTFYHQAPVLDATAPSPNEAGRYDFILSSEVMEHVPPPVERAFANLCGLLKPDGFLVLTVPYRLGGETAEHFPELNEYTLAAPGGRTVLVNRRRDGSLEVFSNLSFHGGHGSTLEMRVFSEESLKQVLLGAGFRDVHIASENVPEFGVEHAETWSLPVLARKGHFQPPAAEIALAYRDACRRASHLESELAAIRGEYGRHIEFHKTSQAAMERQLTERAEWVRKVEADFEQRTQWALQLEREKEEALKEFARVQASEAQAWQRVASLEKELAEARAARAQLESRLWTRVGRRLGAT
jgi:SAM-dependent methyltransferase